MLQAGRRGLANFSEDAIVEDEGKEYHGIPAIKEWSDGQHFTAQITLEPTKVMQNEDDIAVTAKVDGNFDKTGLPDPLLLDFHFCIRGDKIARLTIALTE